MYLHTYGQLPENYITKRDAEDLGWDSKKGNLWEVAPGMSIGGSRFGNYEELCRTRRGGSILSVILIMRAVTGELRG